MEETLGSSGEMSGLITPRSLASLWDGLVQEGGCHLKFGVRITAGHWGSSSPPSFACSRYEKGPEKKLGELELDNLYSPFSSKPLQDSINFHGEFIWTSYGHIWCWEGKDHSFP